MIPIYLQFYKLGIVLLISFDKQNLYISLFLKFYVTLFKDNGNIE